MLWDFHNLTNSIFDDNVENMMFATKMLNSLKKTRQLAIREKRRTNRVDLVTEQVKQVLKDSDQQLILMVRS